MIKAVLIDDVPAALKMLASDLNQYCPEVEMTIALEVSPVLQV